MTAWIATSFGTLDLRGVHGAGEVGTVAVTPVNSADPIVLREPADELWRRLVAGPIDDETLDDDDRAVLHDFESLGLASTRLDDPFRTRTIPVPWLSSFVHELVYALVASIARRDGIDVVFVKGPMLRAQGLREREHSGDVDVWVSPLQQPMLARAMQARGWRSLETTFTGTPIAHSLTLLPGGWGCEIDVHVRFPGITVADASAFAHIRSRSVACEFAGVTASAPDIATHAVISALHQIRPLPGAPPAAERLEGAIAALCAAGWQEADRAAESLGARGPLEPAFAGAGRPSRSGEVALHDWGWRDADRGADAMRAYFRVLPVRYWPRVIRRMLWPTVEALYYPDKDSPRTRVAVAKRRRDRLIRKLRTLLRRDGHQMS